MKGAQSDADKCAIDHILDAQKKGEINEDNVLYIIENINVAGKYSNNEMSSVVNLAPRFLITSEATDLVSLTTSFWTFVSKLHIKLD